MKGGRAVILPTPCNPILLTYWFSYYQKFIKPEIDTLYVHLNGNISDEIRDYLLDLFNQKGIIIKFTPYQIEHGDAIDQVLDLVTEEHVMLIEDDCFVFRGGFVDKMFTLLENNHYLMIGSKRGSCGKEILEASKKKYNLDYSGYGDTGCNFWPSYFFIATQSLRDTNRHFKAKHFPKGFYSKELDYYFQDDCYGDTFVYTSMQLMDKFPQDSIFYIPQNHASPDDKVHYEKRRLLFDGNSKYIHIGSLSSFNVDLDEKMPEITSVHEKMEWERRVAFLMMFWESFNPPKELMKYYVNYELKIAKMIADKGLAISRINKFKAIYRTLGL